MAVHAVVRDEQLRALIAPGRVSFVRVRELSEPAGQDETRLDVVRMLHEWRDASLGWLLLLLRRVGARAAGNDDQHEKFFHRASPSENILRHFVPQDKLLKEVKIRTTSRPTTCTSPDPAAWTRAPA